VAKKLQKTMRWIYKKRWTLLTVAAIVALLLVFFGRNFYTIYELERQKSTLQSQIQSEEDRSDALDAEYQQIGSKNYVEYVARKYLKLFYPDEKVVVTVQADQNTGTDQNQTQQEGTNP
jgi:cell division protein DivIC